MIRWLWETLSSRLPFKGSLFNFFHNSANVAKSLFYPLGRIFLQAPFWELSEFRAKIWLATAARPTNRPRTNQGLTLQTRYLLLQPLHRLNGILRVKYLEPDRALEWGGHPYDIRLWVEDNCYIVNYFTCQLTVRVCVRYISVSTVTFQE